MSEEKDIVTKALDKLKPVLSNLSFGAVMGYCSGTAMKKVGRSLAVVIGIGFTGIQSAVTAGYIEVDWHKISGGIIAKLDVNQDGKLDVEDAKSYWKKIKSVLTNKVPAAGGFSVGFMYGVKTG